ncbi:MAG TPA: hypothetical protein VM598_05550 [Bdellovibrionota bacterium]|nr:hypothetical protein [Bdellovibrionota bacterium]
MRNEEGHVLLETMAALSLSAVAVVALFGLLRDGWNGARCAHLVFEAGRARLSGATELRTRVEVRITETPDTVIAEGSCGSARERVEFVKLESARW